MALVPLRERFVTGAQSRGVDEATAEEVFRQLTCFAGFGFCKSHAAAFALVAYQTLYLKKTLCTRVLLCVVQPSADGLL